jgi:hypothetical protein
MKVKNKYIKHLLKPQITTTNYALKLLILVKMSKNCETKKLPKMITISFQK